MFAHTHIHILTHTPIHTRIHTHILTLSNTQTRTGDPYNFPPQTYIFPPIEQLVVHTSTAKEAKWLGATTTGAAAGTTGMCLSAHASRANHLEYPYRIANHRTANHRTANHW